MRVRVSGLGVELLMRQTVGQRLVRTRYKASCDFMRVTIMMSITVGLVLRKARRGSMF